MISQIPNVSYQNTSKLFWNQFAFKITLTTPVKNYRRFAGSSIDFVKAKATITPALPVDKTSYRIQNNFYSLSLYFTKAEDVEALAQHALTTKFTISEIIRPESADILQAIQQDHKIVLRDSLFYKHFEWRVVFKRIDREQLRDLTDWVNQFFDADSDLGVRYSFTEGVNCVLYLRDEDDVVMTKLTQSQRVRKVEKAVLLNNNNNNTTGNNETGTLSQTS